MKIMSDNIPDTKELNNKFESVMSEVQKTGKHNMVYNLVAIALLLAILGFDLAQHFGLV